MNRLWKSLGPTLEDVKTRIIVKSKCKWQNLNKVYLFLQEGQRPVPARLRGRQEPQKTWPQVVERMPRPGAGYIRDEYKKLQICMLQWDPSGLSMARTMSAFSCNAKGQSVNMEISDMRITFERAGKVWFVVLAGSDLFQLGICCRVRMYYLGAGPITANNQKGG